MQTQIQLQSAAPEPADTSHPHICKAFLSTFVTYHLLSPNSGFVAYHLVAHLYPHNQTNALKKTEDETAIDRTVDRTLTEHTKTYICTSIM